MRNKLGIDNLDIDDLYNNLKVYEADIKGSSRSSSNSQDVDFISAEGTSSTNELNVAYSFSTAIGHSSQAQGSSSYADELVAMLSIRVKRFYKKTGRKMEFNGKEPVGFDKTKVECFNCHRRGYFARDCRIARNPRNMGRDDGIAGYRGRDIGKRPVKEEDEKALKEVTKTVFDNRSSDEENSLASDRFKKDRMAKKSVLPNNVRKGTSHRESRPVWNNVQRINHQNKFAPTAVFTRLGRISVSAAKLKAAASTSAAKPVNTAGPNRVVNTAGSNAVSDVKGNGVTPVKASASCVWTRVNEIDHISKDNRWICTRKDYVHPQQALKNKGMVDSGCSRHMTGNKAYLADYQEINDEGFVAFGSSKGKITGKDLLLPITFWAEAVNTACYVLNRALVTKPHNKTSYELLNGRSPRLDFMRPFGCPVTILNTLDLLGKFEGKADEGFLVGYPVTSKALRVFNTKIIKVKENLHVRFLENKPNVEGTGPNWLFDIDSLTNSMNYILVSAGNQTNKNAGPQDTNGNAEKKASDTVDSFCKEFEQGCMDQRGAAKARNTNSFNIVSNPVNTASTSGTFSVGGPSSPHPDAFIPDDTLLHVAQDDSQIPDLEDTVELKSTGIFTSAYDDDLDTSTSPVQSVGAEADFNNIESSIVIEPKKVAQALDDESWVEAMLDKLLIEAIKIFLAFASFMGFTVYQMDVKSAFLYGTIEEEVYVSQPPGFIDPWCMLMILSLDPLKSVCDEFEALMHKRFEMSSMRELTFFLGLQMNQSKEVICISQDKYVAEIMKKFDFSSVRTASTPIESQKPLVKNKEATDVDVHLYISMIGSLMYLKGQPKLGLWYPKDSPFDLEAYSDSDYVRANLDRKSTIRGCQFLGRRLISWQRKKQTIVVTSTTEAEYVAAANCCGQVL
nr:uncharacterized mitochondrial protein AtMg00810-like [Tanacetum cinerariifolium]